MPKGFMRLANKFPSASAPGAAPGMPGGNGNGKGFCPWALLAPAVPPLDGASCGVVSVAPGAGKESGPPLPPMTRLILAAIRRASGLVIMLRKYGDWSISRAFGMFCSIGLDWIMWSTKLGLFSASFIVCAIAGFDSISAICSSLGGAPI